MPVSYPPAQMRSLRYLEICVSEQVGISPVLIMFLGMAENVSEQVGMSQINLSFIQSCGSALVCERIHNDLFI